MNVRLQLTALGCLVGLAGVFVLGREIGVKDGVQSTSRTAQIQHAAVVERDVKIVERITKVNPAATIKDFGGDFAEHLVGESQRAGIDFRLVMAIIEKESQWNPRAIGSSGEVGLMQMLPSTAVTVARQIGDSTYAQPMRNKNGPGYYDLGTLGDPRRAVTYGVAYLKVQVESFGMNEVAIRAYNRNPDRAREHRPGDSYAEDVAFRYVRLVHDIGEERK